MYCGSCMRDNALTTAYRRLGHDAVLVPLYTPLKLDEPTNAAERIFFGGLNVFLQQKTSIFKKTPEWLDRTLDNPKLINFATSFGVKTKPQDLGELVTSMLRGEDGNQKKEIDKLAAWLKTSHKPDVIILSNALLAGMLKRIKQDLNCPVVVTLQGEDFFIDGLPPDLRDEAWRLLAECAKDADAFVPVSQYYGEVMARRMQLPADKVFPVHNGIELHGYAPAAEMPAVPTIGYLSRFALEKGVKTLVDAFIELKKHPGLETHAAAAGGIANADGAVAVR
nr:glycosyltransferase [Oscillatoria laete-virens]